MQQQLALIQQGAETTKVGTEADKNIADTQAVGASK
jgi:hypothetical protein